MRADFQSQIKGDRWSQTSASRNIVRYRQRLLVYVCAVTALAFMSATVTTIKTVSAQSPINLSLDAAKGKR